MVAPSINGTVARVPSMSTPLDPVRSSRKATMPHVLTVAGSDSGAGAGIQADIKACGALGAYCSSVITAVTAQNTVGVQGVHPVPEEFVKEQLRSVLSDMNVDVVKTGMLPSVGIVKVLCNSLREFPVRALVVDPVMVSTSGDILSAPSTLAEYRDELLPMADIVTPNLKEASALLGGASLATVDDMCFAAKAIHSLGPRYVLVKGGDLPDSSDAIDVFFDGEQCHELRGSRIITRNTHGTGCTLASCIAAELAKGSSILQAVQAAKRFVESALRYSKDIVMGNGPQGPFDHLFRMNNHEYNANQKSPFKADNLFLYAVTDSRMNKKWGRSITEAVRACIEGGATIVQLRSLLKEIGVEDPKVEAICKDFLRGRCLRSAKNCRFAHHTPVDHQAVICQDFMRGSCDRKSCRFSHVLVAEKMPEVCQDFIRGKCERMPCRYSHFVLPQMPEICQDFLRGRCERKTCRYSHVLVPEMPQAHLQSYGRPLELPQSPPRTGKEQEMLQVCRDFLKKMCKRDPCKYAHPDSKTVVVDNQVEVCRDFCRGICHRTVCRFYHPPAVKVAK